MIGKYALQQTKSLAKRLLTDGIMKGRPTGLSDGRPIRAPYFALGEYYSRCRAALKASHLRLLGRLSPTCPRASFIFPCLAVAVRCRQSGFDSGRAWTDIPFVDTRAGLDGLVDGVLQSGMEPVERDAKGYTAQIVGTYNGQAKTVDFLIQKGANPCATDARGNSSQRGVALEGESVIAHRLIAAHCDVNARNDAGQTALMMAAMFGRTDIVKMLLVNWANP